MNEHYQLSTPENVPINYELAGVGSRFVAALLDSIIIFAVQLGLMFMAMLASVMGAITLNLGPRTSSFSDLWSGLGLLVLAAVVLLSFAILLGYPLFFEIVWNGQTPGKRMIGIRVIRDDGGPLTAAAAVIRNVVRLVDFLPAYYIIGAVTMLIDGKGRRLGDMAAGTMCVKEHRDIAADGLIVESSTPISDEPVVASELDNMGHLTYEDRHLVKEYLLRRSQLEPVPAHDLAIKITGRIASKLGVDLAGESAEDFLARVGSALSNRPIFPH